MKKKMQIFRTITHLIFNTNLSETTKKINLFLTGKDTEVIPTKRCMQIEIFLVEKAKMSTVSNELLVHHFPAPPICSFNAKRSLILIS